MPSYFNWPLRIRSLWEIIGVAFYIRGSVHRDSILIRSNKMQQYADIYLLQIYSTCFGCPSHPSSGVHEIVTAAAVTISCTPDDECDAHPKHVEYISSK